MVYKYSKDADVLTVEVSKKPIDYAQEMGDLVVHFTKDNKPVLLEILNAKSFIQQTAKIIPSQRKNRILTACQ